jgi:hypothetical protein
VMRQRGRGVAAADEAVSTATPNHALSLHASSPCHDRKTHTHITRYHHTRTHPPAPTHPPSHPVSFKVLCRLDELLVGLRPGAPLDADGPF